MAKAKKAPPAGATSAQLAELFDCSTRQIELWAKDGVVVRIARGLYDARRSTTGVVRHLREQAAGRAGVDPQSDTAAAKAKRDEAQARLLDFRFQKMSGEVIDVGTVRDVWAPIMRYLRAFVLGLPNKINAEVPTLTPHDVQTIKRICRDGLEDAAMGRGLALSGTKTDDDVPD